jgi:hypothetical protein
VGDSNASAHNLRLFVMLCGLATAPIALVAGQRRNRSDVKRIEPGTGGVLRHQRPHPMLRRHPLFDFRVVDPENGSLESGHGRSLLDRVRASRGALKSAPSNGGAGSDDD